MSLTEKPWKHCGKVGALSPFPSMFPLTDMNFIIEEHFSTANAFKLDQLCVLTTAHPELGIEKPTLLFTQSYFAEIVSTLTLRKKHL